MEVYLHGFGRHLPERVVTNLELAPALGRTPEWIENASGIRERRWAAGETTAADMGLAAALDCLAKTQSAPESIGLLLVASGSAAATTGVPGPAGEIAQRLGLGTTPAIDLPIASAGSIFGLVLAMQLAPAYGNILVVATEKMSSVIGTDPNVAILFGDGAGAALVSTQSPPGGWVMLDGVLHSDGAYRDDLALTAGGSLRMNGLAVILQASRKLPAVIQEVLARQHMNAGQVGTFLLHQANLNLLARVGKALGAAPEKIFSNVQRYGNTSSASLLIAASEWAESNSIDAPVVFAGFGAGLHWGALIARPA